MISSRRSSAPKRPAVLGEVDRVDRSAEQRHPRLLQRLRQPQGRLTAELDDDSLGALDLADGEHVLLREWLEVETVGGVVVGGDGLGVAVDHHRVALELARGHCRVDAAVVELDALADPVWPRAEDHHRGTITPVHLAGGSVRRAALMCGVEVGRPRLELGGAGVDGAVGALQAVGAVALGRQRPELAQEPGIDHRRLLDPLQLHPALESGRGSDRSGRTKGVDSRSSSSPVDVRNVRARHRARESASPWRRTRGRSARSPCTPRPTSCGWRAGPRRRGTSRRRSAGSW